MDLGHVVLDILIAPDPVDVALAHAAGDLIAVSISVEREKIDRRNLIVQDADGVGLRSNDFTSDSVL